MDEVTGNPPIGLDSSSTEPWMCLCALRLWQFWPGAAGKLFRGRTRLSNLGRLVCGQTDEA